MGSLAGICLFIFALVVIHNRLKEYRFSDIAAQIHQTTFATLLLAVFLTILDYFVLTFYDKLALRYINHPLNYTNCDYLMR